VTLKFNHTLAAVVFSALAALIISAPKAPAQINPGVTFIGPPVAGNCVEAVNQFQIEDAGAACGSGSGGTPGNPTATAKDTAVNGSATTYMRSDAAPAVQKASSAQFGLVEGDGSSLTVSGGIISCTTASTTQLGCIKIDGTTITISSGVISAVQPAGANPTATAKDTAVNGSATTFMRSDAAPAVQKATNALFGIVEVDNSTITASAGVISAVQPAGANPTGTAGPAAVNGSATTFMRSDAAPAIQKASSSQFGIVEVDNVTVTSNAGVISAVGGAATSVTAGVAGTSVLGTCLTTYVLYDNGGTIYCYSPTQLTAFLNLASSSLQGLVPAWPNNTTTFFRGDGTYATPSYATGANPTATAGPSVVNGSAATFMRSDAAPAVQTATTGQLGLVEPDGSTITIAAGKISAAAAKPPYSPMFVANSFYTTFFSANSAGTVHSSGYQVFMPIWIGEPVTITGISFRISAAYSGTGNGFSVGLYNSGDGGSDPAANRPFTLLASPTSFSTSTSTGATTLSFSSPYAITTAGWYWISFMYGDATQTLYEPANTGLYQTWSVFVGSATLSNLTAATPIYGLSFAGSGGTMTSGFTSSSTFTELTNTQGNMAWMAIEIASVP